MAVAVKTLQESPKYSENKLNKFATFNDAFTWNTAITGGSGSISAVNSPSLKYKGTRGMLITTNDCDAVINAGDDSMQITVNETGTYILSGRLFADTIYSSQVCNFSFYVYRNAVLTYQFDVFLSESVGFVFGVHNTYFQQLYFDDGDVVDFVFKIGNEGGAYFQFGLDGLKLELDDRNLYLPSRYTTPPDTQAGLSKYSFDYNDLATASVPISYTTGDIVLTNDGLGTFTNVSEIPSGVTIYNTSTNEFDFSSLQINDVVMIRLDITVETSSANQFFRTWLELSQGVSPYHINFHSYLQFKTAGTYENLTVEMRVVIQNEETRDNPAQFKFSSDASADIVVNGYNVTILQNT